MPDDTFHASDTDRQTEPGGGLVPLGSQSPYEEADSGSPAHTRDQEHLEDLAREVLELKLVLLSDTADVGQSIEHLRRQNNWLTGLLISVTAVLAGTLTWLALTLKADQAQLAQSVEAIATDTVEVERIDRLEDRLEELAQRPPEQVVQDLNETQETVNALQAELNTSQTQIQSLESNVTELTTSINTRRQTISILANALQDLINQEDTAQPIAPAASPSPVPSPAEATPSEEGSN